MRVAAQEAFGGATHEASGTRSTGAGAASAGGAFVALLALLQNGAAAGEVAATPEAADTTDRVDGEPSDAGADPAGEAAEGGVVVSLSVAANAVAAGAATFGVGQAVDAAAQEGTKSAIAFTSAQGGKNAAVAQAFAAIADPTSGASADASAGAARGVSVAAGAASTDDAGAPAAESPAAAAKPIEAGVVALARGANGAVANGDPAKSAAGAAAHTRLAAHSEGVPARNGDGGANEAAKSVPATTPAPTTAAQVAAAQAAASEGSAGSTAEQGTVPQAAQSLARRASDGVRPERRIADVEDAGDGTNATDDVSGSEQGATGSGATRELPAAVRVLSEPLPVQNGQAHDARHAADAALRADALGAARSDATAASASGNGTTRLRAAGFASGEAGLPSWVERLASPEGLAATRRGNTLHLDLEPNGLGRIELRLSFGRDGVRASVLTEHEHTRSLLASQQPQLAAALEKNDVRLESFLVDVGAQSGGDGREAWRDATDPAAFDQIGLVHTSTSEPVLDEPTMPTRGLVNVRA